VLSQLLSGYAKAFGNAAAIAGFGRRKHNHSTAAAHRRPLGSIVPAELHTGSSSGGLFFSVIEKVERVYEGQSSYRTDFGF
jgi:hypothetical protein